MQDKASAPDVHDNCSCRALIFQTETARCYCLRSYLTTVGLKIVTFGMLAVAACILAWPGAAGAKPDKPVIQGNTATFNGNQSGGILGLDWDNGKQDFIINNPVTQVVINNINDRTSTAETFLETNRTASRGSDGKSNKNPFKAEGGAGQTGYGAVPLSIATGPGLRPTVEIYSSKWLIFQLNQAGNGGNGGDGIAATGYGKGGRGGDGASAGGLTTEFGGVTSLESAGGIWLRSIGGSGGKGGYGYGTGYGLGGNGGHGGSGGPVSLILKSPTYPAETKYISGGSGLVALSQGGNGGDAGASGGAYGEGGIGGRGGSGGSVSVIAKVPIEAHADYGHGISARSLGGNGGGGGNAGGAGAKADNGGQGGSGGTVVVKGDALVTTLKNYACGYDLHSVGGAGAVGGAGGGAAGLGAGGGNGGNGGSISLECTGSISTRGVGSKGVNASSRGGTGGDGGAAGGAHGKGGNGARGGSGGPVSIECQPKDTRLITTTGDSASGIWAESLGAKGGKGANSGGASARGGNGGEGGYSGQITVTNAHYLDTAGKTAHGIYALSQAAAGGNGGSAGGAYAKGGDGGIGGSAAGVTVTNRGYIKVTGIQSQGIWAASLGGSGGSGGSGAGGYGQGGAARGGGPGGAVTINNYAIIDAGNFDTGQVSRGIFAQSIGGFSSKGGSGSGAVAYGGDGNSGGPGGPVFINNTGLIRTWGKDSGGIAAQSVGGGGGSAGMGGGVIVALGGSGDAGGNGGSVTVHHSKEYIICAGERSSAIFAQSLGGGGGDAGGALAVAPFVSSAIGGQGGPGGSGGKVEVKTAGGLSDPDGLIRTGSGEWSPGITAQSLGGGGGKGGWSVAAAAGLFSATLSLGGSGGGGGSGGQVLVDSGAKIQTGSNDSQGILAQSIGGGGGSGGWSVTGSASPTANVSVSLGGSGGTGGSAGAVEVASTRKITTQGRNSHGIQAESTGGGGGAAGWSVAGNLGAANVAVAIGGKGGGGGSGSAVSVKKAGDIETSGASACGILAQSTGGGGGSGDFAVGAGLAAVNATASLGGSGGTGGHGGAVSVQETGAAGHQITTKGVASYGIKAQSTGGGGGSGNFAVSGNVGLAGASLALGGSGSNAGNGGGVTVANAGKIATSGDLAGGILAQSVGGGGGSGGFSVADSVSVVPPDMAGGSVTVGLGGKGGGGGTGGNVTLTHQGAVDTAGHLAPGLEALSTGGGGGKGGFSVAASASLSLGNSPNASIGVSLGGSGGSGADAGDIILTGGGDKPGVSTMGNLSSGITANSTGGGGGSGGFSVAGALAMNPASSGGSVAVSLGGTGSTGGKGGKVQVNLQPADAKENYMITTEGDGSTGVLALSQGGGGGIGGFSVGAAGMLSSNGASASLSLGGKGGSGGDGSSVAFFGQRYFITTMGDYSGGLEALSIGGGGGHGGFSVAGSLSFTKGISGSAAVSLGGQGRSGGDGGKVTMEGRGSVFTTGDNAKGILASSVGGGGGSGGFSVAGAISSSGGANPAGIAASVSLGGSGGQGGHGGQVTWQGSGPVFTKGHNSTAIIAQSVGGGGGDGGFSVGAGGSLSGSSKVNLALGASIAGSGGQGGDGGQVTLKHQGNVETLGSASPGMLAQSVGKGGGNGGFSVAGALSFVQQGAQASGSGALSLGGSGGQGGKGSDVGLAALGLSDTIQTRGAQSQALLAQSIGGGGGNGDFSVAAGATVSGLASAAVSLGGGGGNGGTSGAVRLENEPSLKTLGDTSTGMLAQSVAGGGGNGGFSISGAANFKTPSKLSFAAAVSLGGKGGDGNTAGAVSVANAAGRIATQGKQAGGILAQSIGGGGGNGGFSGSLALNVAPQDKTFTTEADSISLGGSGGVGNTGGNVTVSSISDISTQGDDAAALLAQSIGGGGGNGNVSAALLWTGGEKVKFQEVALTNVSVSIGGSGGKGGDGGAVAVDTTRTQVNGVDYASSGKTISTAGEASAGIYAQSVGGGGGQGSYRFTLANVNTNAFSIVTEKAYKLINLGCKGGEGGKGNAVAVNDNSGTIKTQGSQSEGIFAQSVGGGGGKSGFGVKVGVSWDYKGQGSFFGNTGISLGGSGASGSNGGRAEAVTVTEIRPASGTKIIQTQGDQSDGICAQSVGGGGGKAGLSIKGSCNSGFTIPDSPMNFNHGGNGGDGGAIKVTALSDISTAGDLSRGIYAASIGHGGGDGGLFIGANWTTRAKADWWPFAGINSSMGGNGGEGGKGLQVSVDHTGSVGTLSNSASGIHAQSLGGGGGSGGGSISADGYNPQAGQKPKISGSISRGGKGGKGGSADAVTVTNRGAISTGCADEEGFLAGNYAYGIFAQSLGGGGGDGGFSIAFAEQKGYGSFSGSFGGDGGSGHKAGQVSVANVGSITTRGDGAAGIYAHSLGGGGGSGGFSISGGITTGQSLGLSIGGKGGDGGDAGPVSISSTGAVRTGYQDPAKDGVALVHGHDAPGLDAASIGGGGGSGGFSIAGNVSLSGEQSLRGSANVSVGGSGGKGGVGGPVDITNALSTGESIHTLGDRSPGLSALSQGGGGGHGGYSIAGSLQINNPKEMKGVSASVSVGGSGGTGGTAGNVTIVNSEADKGSIATQGQSSPGLRAQSIAGGGGNGGFSVAGGLRLGPLALGVAVGGSGGSGNTSGKITVQDGGEAIATGGDGSPGILAQSIGGGGGDGRFGIGGAIAVDPFFSTFASVLAATGGDGGVGGDGQTVAITNRSSLATDGSDSPGILAQSIGGGGGSNGFSVRGEIMSQITQKISVGSTKAASGQGREVTITSLAPSLTTQGINSSGLIGQSIGGGGGVSWVTVDHVKQVDQSASSFHLGGQGGSSGDGGTVAITAGSTKDAKPPAAVIVQGRGACGLIAQSIGGGGGILSNNALSKSLAMGGANATKGKGGNIQVSNHGVIQTFAQGSFGVVAQSIGGGGGLALYTGTEVIHEITTTLPSGDTTNGGDGGAVTMANYGKVATTGRGAIGMVAQSLGGGGGLNVLTGEAGSAGGTGSGGSIRMDNYGDITTVGAYAHGIFAQSAGGADQGGRVTVNNYKSISVAGAGARPIYAVCAGQAGQDRITITNWDDATITGSPDGCAPIYLSGGKNNALTNYGTIFSYGALVEGNPSNFRNYGSINGLSFLGKLVNLGTVNPGSSPGTLSITGAYSQSASGAEIVEIESLSDYDRLIVSGAPGTATLAGTVAPTPYNGFKPLGNQQLPGIVTATGGVKGTFDTIAQQQITPTLSWQTRYHPNCVDLSVARSYTGANLGLSDNQRSVGTMLNCLAGVTGGDLNQVLNTIDYLGVAGVQEALKEISPEKAVALSNLALTGASFQMHHQAQRLTDRRFAHRAATLGGGGLAGVTPFGSSQFSGLMLAFNSPSLSGVITQPRGEAHTPWGVYLYPTVIIGNQGSTANQTGYNFTMAGFTLGADYRLQDNLIVGLATGYSYTNANYSGSGGGVQANTWPLTVYGAYLGRSFYAYGSVGYVLNLFNQERHIQFGGLKRTADSSPTGNQLHGYAEAGYDLNLKPLIVTPVASLACSSLWLGGYGETGAGTLNLEVASQNATSLQTGVGLKIAAPFQTARATIIPQFYATYQHEFANNSRGLNASLSQGGGAFTFTTDAPQRDFALVGAKVDLLSGKNLQLSLNYNAEVGRSSSLAQSIYTGLRWQF